MWLALIRAHQPLPGVHAPGAGARMQFQATLQSADNLRRPLPAPVLPVKPEAPPLAVPSPLGPGACEDASLDDDDSAVAGMDGASDSGRIPRIQ